MTEPPINLHSLFDIVYYNQEVNDKYSDFMETFPLNNMLNTPKEITDQFILIVNKNNVVNNNYNKIKLEFHDINKNSINNELILETLTKLQSIINDSLNDSEYIVEQDNVNYAIPIENDNGELEQSIIPSNVETDIKTILKKKEYLKLHLFQKKYNEDNVTYIATLSLNLDEENTLIKDPEDLNKLSDLTYYYNTVYRDFNDYESIYDYLDHYNVLDDDLIYNLSKIMSGFYLNIHDIKFQMILKLLILTNIGNKGYNSKFLSYKQYTKNSSINNYFCISDIPNKYEKIMLDNLNICCDTCNIIISDCNEDEYYHNHYGGDLCNKCYNSKKNVFFDRLKYIKKQILLVGKQTLFKKDLEKTKKYIKKKKYKIKKKNYYHLLEKMNKNLVSDPTNEKICNICLCNLTEDIYVGSKCGHCFHKQCIEHSSMCQICRTETDFIKLYL